MRYDVDLVKGSEAGPGAEETPSFAAFSLTHAECGDDVQEARIGEHTLLEWCLACAVVEIFGPCEV